MQLFIANTTHQYVDFIYRIPEGPKLIIQRIAPGNQVRISARRGDLNQNDIDAIFDQHRKYGLIRSDEVRRGDHYLHPLVAGVDKPVPVARIIEQLRLNREVLIEQGKQTRQAAAVALNDQIENNIAMNGGPDVLRQVEISVEEMSPTRVFDRNGREGDNGIARELDAVPPIGEGVRVTRDEQTGEPPARNTKGRGRSRRTRATL